MINGESKIKKGFLFGKEGFTLIELLITIVMIGVIAAIATAMISNIIEKTKREAAASSVVEYVDAVGKSQVMLYDGEVATSLVDKVYQVEELNDLGITVTGETPDYGWVELENGYITNYVLHMSGYSIEYSKETGEPIISKTNSIDKTAPIASVNKKVETDKVTIELNVTDNDSGIDYVMLPNNEYYSLRSTYDSNGKDSSTKILIMELSALAASADMSIENIKTSFSNVTVNQTMTLNELLASDYDIYISDCTVWGSSRPGDINKIFDSGKNIFTSGNDNGYFSIFKSIRQRTSEEGGFTLTKNLTNEFTTTLPNTLLVNRDSQKVVELIDNAEVWYGFVQDGITYGEIGYYKNNANTRWVHCQNTLSSSANVTPAQKYEIYRNAIYRASGKKKCRVYCYGKW